eukprot:TRINITY_DN4303_c0_g1_i7.p1 TRINITY_DN4303_c0_g1~~TRINITY_DN4303_c0_g1_i7.p1  ORF type:complete len:451 (+),score=217.19 TRINITY_DN4303_c0_g1_i7:83-1435(+)
MSLKNSANIPETDCLDFRPQHIVKTKNGEKVLSVGDSVRAQSFRVCRLEDLLLTHEETINKFAIKKNSNSNSNSNPNSDSNPNPNPNSNSNSDIEINYERNEANYRCAAIPPPQPVLKIGGFKKNTVIIGVFSSIDNILAREAIRSTWGSRMTSNIITRFIIADLQLWLDSSEDEEQKKFRSLIVEQVNAEANKYGDLLITPVAEGYRKLGQRLYSFLNHAGSDPHWKQYDLLLKVDDDTYLVADRFIKMIDNLPREKLYWGVFAMGHVFSDPNHPWYNGEYLSLNRIYPSYALGGGYMLSMDVVRWISSSTIDFKVWKGGPEDSQLGTWLSGLNLNRFDASSFSWEPRFFISKSCSNTTLLLHRVDPRTMVDCELVEINPPHDICNCHIITTNDVLRSVTLNQQKNGSVIERRQLVWILPILTLLISIIIILIAVYILRKRYTVYAKKL